MIFTVHDGELESTNSFKQSWLAKGEIDWTYQHLKRRFFH